MPLANGCVLFSVRTQSKAGPIVDEIDPISLIFLRGKRKKVYLKYDKRHVVTRKKCCYNLTKETMSRASLQLFPIRGDKNKCCKGPFK